MAEETTAAKPSSRFSYVRYDEHRAKKQEAFKETFEMLEKLAEDLLMPGRSKALFLTGIEEAYMWAGKSIRDEQILANDAPHEPARG